MSARHNQEKGVIYFIDFRKNRGIRAHIQHNKNVLFFKKCYNFNWLTKCAADGPFFIFRIFFLR